VRDDDMLLRKGVGGWRVVVLWIRSIVAAAIIGGVAPSAYQMASHRTTILESFRLRMLQALAWAIANSRDKLAHTPR